MHPLRFPVTWVGLASVLQVVEAQSQGEVTARSDPQDSFDAWEQSLVSEDLYARDIDDPPANNSLLEVPFTEAPFNGSVWYDEDSVYNWTYAPDLVKYVFCICNCSYISFACCDAPDGIVHESPEHNQGVTSDCTQQLLDTANEDSSSASAAAASASPSASPSGESLTSQPSQEPSIEQTNKCSGSCTGPLQCQSTDHGNCVCYDTNNGGQCGEMRLFPWYFINHRKRSTERPSIAQGDARDFTQRKDRRAASPAEPSEPKVMPKEVLEQFKSESHLNADQLDHIILNDTKGGIWNASTGAAVTLLQP